MTRPAAPSFVGPSYRLAVTQADIQRSVNLCLQSLEVPGKAPYMLASIPGRVAVASPGGAARGAIETNARAYIVFGSGFYELGAGDALALRGTLVSSTGIVELAYGLSQVVIVDGSRGYVFTEATNTFVRITADGFPGANSVSFVDNYFVFTRDRQGQQFQLSAINDATQVDALDFASAESLPDDIVRELPVQAGLLIAGTRSFELFVNTGATDFPFERSRGSGFRVGLVACHSLRSIDNGAMWLGRDESGSGIVYRLNGGQPQRVSTQAVEQALAASTDIERSSAFVRQIEGQTFYFLNAPGVPATWAYEVSSGEWCEVCDIDTHGNFAQGLAVVGLFAFGRHYVGGTDGKLYRIGKDIYTNGAAPLVRERVSPHAAVPGRAVIFFRRFVMDCQTGGAGQGVQGCAELSFSDDAGKSFSNPILHSIGRVGERLSRVMWTMLGRSRDRVWKVRYSGPTPFSIINVSVESQQGTN